MKKVNLIFVAILLFISSCSIDQMDEPIVMDGLTSLITTGPFESDAYPNGGYIIRFGLDLNRNGFLEPNEVTSQITMLNGFDGADGKDGINGIDGIDGIDGVSSTIKTVEVEDGIFLYITVGDVETVTFVRHGTDGIDGIDGEDGNDVNVRTEKAEGGYYIHITNYKGTISIFIPDGEDGKTLLSNINVNKITDCTNGGVVLEIGTDLNDNGILESNEITSEESICNGTNGTSETESFMLVETDNSYCGTSGGIVVIFGDDNNGNGIFDESEKNFKYICNGEDGYSSLVAVEAIVAGSDCENGGIMIKTGLDKNRDEVLQNEEVQSTEIICNGTDGEAGEPGPQGNDGYNSLIELNKVDECVIISSGLDLNRNDELEANEILYTEEVCGCDVEQCNDCEIERVPMCFSYKVGNCWVSETIYVSADNVDVVLLLDNLSVIRVENGSCN